MGEVTRGATVDDLAPLRSPEPLSARHDVSGFDCGNAELDRWLARQAVASEGRSARTYVVAHEGRVVAYYSLAAGAVVRGGLPKARHRRNMPDQVPIVVIGRLAVDRRFQGLGLGRGLLKDAILRGLSAAEVVGIRAIVVHAIDEKAGAFYRRIGFLPSPLNALTFVLPAESARAAL
jgi:GNAT superfamily N-acetyltransferase